MSAPVKRSRPPTTVTRGDRVSLRAFRRSASVRPFCGAPTRTSGTTHRASARSPLTTARSPATSRTQRAARQARHSAPFIRMVVSRTHQAGFLPMSGTAVMFGALYGWSSVTRSKMGSTCVRLVLRQSLYSSVG
jgi:hypothetical protein